MCVESEDHSGREGGVVKGRDQIRNGQVTGRTVRITLAGDVVRVVKIECEAGGGVAVALTGCRRKDRCRRAEVSAEKGGAV